VADLLVTGTDTGVGKTVVAAALVMALRQLGAKAVGFKPIETGLSATEIADSEVLAIASGSRSALVAPLLRLNEPLAPAVAAERAGVVLNAEAVAERVRALRAAGHTIVVEGAGGLLVPLAWGYTALDLAAETNLTAVLVARAGLGTLNHVALSLEALARREVPVLAVLLNGRGDPPDLAEATNPAALAKLAPDVPILVLPRQVTSTPLSVARALVPALVPLLTP
jgi:dethiobiotin synthetase